MYREPNQKKTSIEEFVISTLNTYQDAVLYLRTAHGIIYSNPNYFIPILIDNVERSLINQNPTLQISRLSCEKWIEYWVLVIASDVLRNSPNLNSVDYIILEDMDARIYKLNTGEINRNSIGVNPNNIQNSPSPNIFTSGSVVNRETNIINRNANYDSTKSDDSILDLIMNSPSTDSVEPKTENTDTNSNQGNVFNPSQNTNKSTEFNKELNDILDILDNDKSTSTIPEPVFTLIPDDEDEKSTNLPDEDVKLVDNTHNEDTDSNEEEVSPEQYVINGLKNGDIEEISEEEGDSKGNVIESHKVDSVANTVNAVTYYSYDISWQPKEAVNMSEDERVKYIEHELNQAEIARYNNIANYDTNIKPVIEAEKKSEQPDPIIRTDDLYFVNKLIYTSRSSELSGTDEYFDAIHVDGKGVVAIIGECGVTNSVYLNNDAIRNTILGFNDKVISLTNLDVFVKHLIESGRGGNTIRKVLAYKLTNWINDLLILPRKNGIPILELTGNFEEDVRKFIIGAEIGTHVDSAMDLLMMKFDSIKAYIPSFKSLSDLYINNYHLPIMDIIPPDEYGRCITAVNYTAMVRIPVDFMALGLDVSKCVENHFIAKQGDFKQFFMLEQTILNLAKSPAFDDVKHIKLLIADSSGNVAIFKNIGEGVAIMKIDKR